MHTIRAKLILNIGAILLLVAILSFFLPRYFVEKDIDETATKLTDKFSKSRVKVQLAFTTLVSAQFIQQVAQLDGLTRLLAQQETLLEPNETLREKAGEILQYAVNLAYIQISDSKETVVVAPENATLYSAEWAKLDEEAILIRLPDGRLFEAELHPYETEPDVVYFFLYPVDQSIDTKELTFHSFKDQTFTFNPEETPLQLFKYLTAEQDQLIDKAQMIRMLARKPKKAVGMLSVDSTFEEGYVLLDNDVYLEKPEIEQIPLPKFPYLLLRQDGDDFYLDYVHYLFLQDLRIVVGFSLSKVAKQITSILQNPILLSSENSEGLLFFPDGSQTILEPGKYNLNVLNYGGIAYHVDPHNIGELTVSTLTPVDQMATVNQLLNRLRDGLVRKISGNLLSISLLLLLIALFFLARISKRMTRPITQLAQASQEIGKGHYEDVKLPNIEKRQDEISTLTHSFEEMVIALRDREKIRGALNKVVSKEVATEILKSDIELGGEERVVTLFFSDIRGFTALSNHFSPQAMIQMLNRYMTHMCHIIDQTHGVVDKFVGDEIMALYGAPLPLEEQADRALEAASRMIHDLKEWNALQLQNGKKPLYIGIGVHTGTVCTGNMGAENRLNYTAIGANVNLASRMCAAAKPMETLVSQATIDALKHPELYRFEPVPPMKLKGFDDPVSLFKLVDDEKMR